MHAVATNVCDRAPVAVSIDRGHFDRLRVPAKGFQVAPRDLAIGLRPLRGVDFGQAKDGLNVAILNGERISV
jgi:hypothetical protein